VSSESDALDIRPPGVRTFELQVDVHREMGVDMPKKRPETSSLGACNGVVPMGPGNPNILKRLKKLFCCKKHFAQVL